jgi:hypothetical protein
MSETSSNNWQDRFYEFIAEFLRNVYGWDATKVTYVEELAYESHGCETCGSGIEYNVDVTYVNSAGQKVFENINGKLSELFA